MQEMDVHEFTDRLGGRFDDLRDKAAGALAAEHTPECRELGRTRHALDRLTDRLDDLDTANEERYARLADRLESGGSWFARLFLLAVGAGLGAAIAYLMDPDTGRGRRSRLTDQLGAQARDLKDTAAKRASYAAGAAKGAVVETAKERLGGEDDDVDPHTLRQRVQSQVIGPTEGALDVVVAVHDQGVVSLKGRVRDAETEQRLIDLTRAVPGVSDVRDELHVG